MTGSLPSDVPAAPGAAHAFDLAALAKGDVPWSPWRGDAATGKDRVDIFRLYGAPGSGGSAALLRYAKGARLPPHEHTGYEQIFILAGSQEDERGVYPAGTMVINPPGSHHAVWAPDGCIALVVWASAIVFQDANGNTNA
jgi:quercetin dioxygenase-like cupin family protein